MTEMPFGYLPRQFSVGLFDPPWHFATRSPKGGAKSPQAHYQTMSLAEICALPVADLMQPDSVVVMWTTAPHLPQALAVLDAWGHRYKTAGAWAKRTRTDAKWQFGAGYIFRSAAEFFIVGTRGRPKQRSRSVRNLIVAPVGRHSEKPPELHDAIEQLWDGPYFEGFARTQRPGWSCWGNEMPVAA